MKFSFHSKELNNWKARVTERAAMVYIKSNLIPSLRQKEGWSDVFIGDLSCPLNSIEKALIKGDKQVVAKMEPHNQAYYLSKPKNIISETNKIFLNRGVFPHSQLLDKCLNLMYILEVSTDGFIFKTKRTNETVSKEKALSQINMNFYKYRLNRENRTHIPINVIEKEQLPDNIPLVNGEIEIVEVKSGKAHIPPHQKKNYRKAIRNGFFLRYIHVDIVSFIGNHFEIEEKLITNPEEVTSFPLVSS